MNLRQVKPSLEQQLSLQAASAHAAPLLLDEQKPDCTVDTLLRVTGPPSLERSAACLPHKPLRTQVSLYRPTAVNRSGDASTACRKEVQQPSVRLQLPTNRRKVSIRDGGRRGSHVPSALPVVRDRERAWRC